MISVIGQGERVTHAVSIPFIRPNRALIALIVVRISALSAACAAYLSGHHGSCRAL